MAGELELLCAPCGPLSFWKWVMETVSNFSLFEVAPAVQEVGALQMRSEYRPKGFGSV
jgi:hypothetical protein